MNFRVFLGLLAMLSSGLSLNAQTNVFLTNPVAEQVLLGNYNPAQYAPTTVIDGRADIVQGIVDRISPDTLKHYLEILESFETRNTGSDTVSAVRGIGAARRWMRQEFDAIGQDNDNRLVTGYLQFDQNLCGATQHRNVFAILPGLDTSRKDILLVEAHMDTRCESLCDTACLAAGAEDNGSGTALVMELARVMSKYAFDRTIVFTLVTGEEQGLAGADAWSGYIKGLDIPFLACFNNDVVGGIYCGTTSSPPSCPNPNEIDSLNLRLFSFSPLNDTNFVSVHKQLARYVKLQQLEEIKSRVTVPMNINLQIREDRQGRGGDHIPFREKGLSAIRFTCQNEHGDGSGTFPDRQHSTRDILGVDTNSDQVLDSFYVDFNYLSRMTSINAVGLGLLANSPPVPQIPTMVEVPGGVDIYMDQVDHIYDHYRVGIRRHGSGDLYFDRVETYMNTTKLFVSGLLPGETYAFSVMNVDDDAVESLFTVELEALITGVETTGIVGLDLFQIRPNPAGTQTELVIKANTSEFSKGAKISFKDLSGKEIKTVDLSIENGVNRFAISLEDFSSGTYFYSLLSKGKTLQTKRMVVIK